jgi:hypothetical protein
VQKAFERVKGERTVVVVAHVSFYYLPPLWEVDDGNLDGEG